MSVSEASYEAIRGKIRGLREESPAARVSEWELQSRLYGGEFGYCWRGEDGEEIEVKHFGSWNREPGPDFINIRAVVNGEEIAGDLELDPNVLDWERHRHFENPNFNRVVIHVFTRKGRKRFFTRTAENRAVTQVCLQTTAGSAKGRGAGVSGCEKLTSDAVRQLAMAAAQFRLRRKKHVFDASRRLHGLQGALFQAIARGLGYKNNKIAFSLVAQRAGLQRARQSDGEALLFGLSGFLNAEDFDTGDAEARGYLRNLWEQWWMLRDKEQRLMLPEDAWSFSALRPANHPHRRMAALAVMAQKLPRIAELVEGAEAGSFLELVESSDHTFWRRFSNLNCQPLPRRMALIGKDRATDLSLNVFLPALDEEHGWKKLYAMPGPTPNRKVTSAAEWLCTGGDGLPLEKAWMQQGLIQLYDDFFPELPADLLAAAEKSS